MFSLLLLLLYIVYNQENQLKSDLELLIMMVLPFDILIIFSFILLFLY